MNLHEMMQSDSEEDISFPLLKFFQKVEEISKNQETDIHQCKQMIEDYHKGVTIQRNRHPEMNYNAWSPWYWAENKLYSANPFKQFFCICCGKDLPDF